MKVGEKAGYLCRDMIEPSLLADCSLLEFCRDDSYNHLVSVLAGAKHPSKESCAHC